MAKPPCAPQACGPRRAPPHTHICLCCCGRGLSQARVILIVDVWHPELSAAARAAFMEKRRNGAGSTLWKA